MRNYIRLHSEVKCYNHFILGRLDLSTFDLKQYMIEIFHQTNVILKGKVMALFFNIIAIPIKKSQLRGVLSAVKRQLLLFSIYPF